MRTFAAMSEDLGQELERNIPLSEMIESLRQELKVAMAKSHGDSVRFAVSEVELELELQVTRDRDVKGGVKFWIASASAGGKSSKVDTHRFKLKLTPRGADGGPLDVSDLLPGGPE